VVDNWGSIVEGDPVSVDGGESPLPPPCSMCEDASCCTLFNVDGSLYTCLVIISNPHKDYPSGGVMCGEVVKGIIKYIH